MLQQTQVSAVIPYYLRFLARFPDLAALAAASEDEVLRLWAGLGYYARARNLHRAARNIVHDLGGEFPRELAAVCALPGIGRKHGRGDLRLRLRRTRTPSSTATSSGSWHAISAWRAIPATNASRCSSGRTRRPSLPDREIEAYTQGLMDLGAGVCVRTAPHCDRCPVAETCVARRENRTAELPGSAARAICSRALHDDADPAAAG